MLFAIALISVTFFGDGALESFLSSYLQRTLAGGVLLSGIGIGSYYFASLAGRLTATAALRRFGERRVVTAAGLLAGLASAPVAGQPSPGSADSGPRRTPVRRPGSRGRAAGRRACAPCRARGRAAH